jgi:hypothetical protein
MRWQLRQGESAGSAVRRCRASLSLDVGRVKGRSVRTITHSRDRRRRNVKKTVFAEEPTSTAPSSR